MLIFIYSVGSCRFTECLLIADDVPSPVPNASLALAPLTSMMAPEVLPLTIRAHRDMLSQGHNVGK